MTPGPEAWHEAGHALVAHLLGGQVREVTLESERDETQAHVAVAWRGGGGVAEAERLAAVALAGPLAELLSSVDDPLDDPLVLSSWRGDWDEAERQLARWHADPAARETGRRQLLRQLHDLLELHDDCLTRLAEALDAHGTLDGQLFADIIEGLR